MAVGSYPAVCTLPATEESSVQLHVLDRPSLPIVGDEGNKVKVQSFFLRNSTSNSRTGYTCKISRTLYAAYRHEALPVQQKLKECKLNLMFRKKEKKPWLRGCTGPRSLRLQLVSYWFTCEMINGFGCTSRKAGLDHHDQYLSECLYH